MRYVLILVLVGLMFPILGCGGGGTEPPAGYSIDDGWITTPTGLKYRDIKVSTTGAQVYSGATIKVYYTGWLDDGRVFDSTDKHGGQPFEFVIGQQNVIDGWDQGLMNLRVGSITELIIPPSLAYGDQPQGSIPANSTLHFRVEIVSVT
jgi:FKBP-type peptidyl-prolyl cis-trans isomerase